jgi:hypothetical protein
MNKNPGSYYTHTGGWDGWRNYAMYPYNTSGMCDVGKGGTAVPESSGGVDYYGTTLTENGHEKDMNCVGTTCKSPQDFTISKFGTITGTIFNSDLTTTCPSVASAPLAGVTVTATLATLGNGLVWQDDTNNPSYTSLLPTGTDGKYSILVPIDNYYLTFTTNNGTQTVNPTVDHLGTVGCLGTVRDTTTKGFFYGENNDQESPPGSGTINRSFGFALGDDVHPITGSAWWQAKDSDITSSGDISSQIPTSYKLILNGGATETGFPGVAVYNGNISLKDGVLSSTSWQANTTTRNAIDYSFNYFLQKVPSTVVFNACGTGNLSTMMMGAVASQGYYWFKCIGAVTLTSTGNPNAINIGANKIVVMVTGGDVDIMTKINLTKGQGFFGLFTDGNINVDPTVGNNSGGTPSLEGIYFADGAISTGVDNLNVTLSPPANCPLGDTNPPCKDPIDVWKFDDGSGSTTVADSGTPGGFAGTWSGTGTHWASGRYSGGGIFSSATKDFVTFSDVTFNADFTISYWYYELDTQGGVAIGIQSGVSSGGNKIQHDVGGKFYIRLTGAGPTGDTSVGMPQNGLWHMVTLVRKSNKAYLYIDAGPANLLFGGASQSSTIKFRNFGKNGTDNSGYYSGKLDQVRIYNYARTDTEIANDYGTVFSNQLYVRGSVVGMGEVNLERVLTDNSTTPAEFFEYAPDQALLLPSVFTSKKTWWQEVSP